MGGLCPTAPGARASGMGGGAPQFALFLPRRPPPKPDEEDERHPELEYFVEPCAGDTVRRDRREDHRDTTRLYAAVPSFPTAIAAFQVPGLSPAIASVCRPGPGGA